MRTATSAREPGLSSSLARSPRPSPSRPRCWYQRQVDATRRIAGWPGQGAALVASCPEHSVLGLVGRCWPEIVERGVPVTRGGVASNDGVSVLYRSIMAPLADDHGKIAGILGAANWRPVS